MYTSHQMRRRTKRGGGLFVRTNGESCAGGAMMKRARQLQGLMTGRAYVNSPDEPDLCADR